mgnify:FL=1
MDFVNLLKLGQLGEVGLNLPHEFNHHILDVRKHLYQTGEADGVEARTGSELSNELCMPGTYENVDDQKHACEVKRGLL